MNCEYIENNLDQVCHGRDALPEQVQAHLAQCQHCQLQVKAHQDYLHMMSGFKAPELALGKAARLLSNAKKQKQAANQASFGFLKGFAAASVMCVALFSSWQVYQQQPDPVVELVSAQGFSTDVTIVIYVPEDMPNADLAISLPDNVQLAGLGNLSKVSWPVDLKAGANTLSLPIDVAAGVNLNQSLRFIANINFENKNKAFEFNVNLNASKNQA